MRRPFMLTVYPIPDLANLRIHRGFVHTLLFVTQRQTPHFFVSLEGFTPEIYVNQWPK